MIGLVRALVGGFGFVAITVNYRLAPEHPFPGPFNDAYDSLLWAIENAHTLKATAKQILIAGTSAGGNLAAAVTQQARKDALNGIFAQILLIPATCHYKHQLTDRYELNSFNSFQGAPMLNTEMMAGMWGRFESLRHRF